MTRHSPSRAGAAGFTLVELLVVVAILVVLATMVLVSVERAGAAANSAACASNLHQLHLALLNYATDNVGRFPDSRTRRGSWWWDISFDVRDKTVAAGAARSVFYCPAGEFQNSDDLWTYSGGYAVTGYAWLLTQSCDLPRDLVSPNQTVSRVSDAAGNRTLLADGTLAWNGNFAELRGGWVGVHRSNHLQAGTFTDESLRKPTGGNHLAGDGSVGWTAFPQMQPRNTGNATTATIPIFWW